MTVSQASSRAIQRWLGRPDPRIRVITEGPDPIFGPRAAGPESDGVLRRHGLRPGERYLLYVGGLSPHKNLPRLVEAFARSGGDDVRLVLTGDVHDVFHTCVPAIRAAIERHGLGGRVILTGFVPDEDLVFLYGRAFALVQPSLLEGFGLPAVEAMACGTPVISSQAGSLPEVIGEAGVYFEPTDVRSIAAVMGGSWPIPNAATIWPPVRGSSRCASPGRPPRAACSIASTSWSPPAPPATCRRWRAAPERRRE